MSVDRIVLTEAQINDYPFPTHFAQLLLERYGLEGYGLEVNWSKVDVSESIVDQWITFHNDILPVAEMMTHRDMHLIKTLPDNTVQLRAGAFRAKKELIAFTIRYHPSVCAIPFLLEDGDVIASLTDMVTHESVSLEAMGDASVMYNAVTFVDTDGYGVGAIRDYAAGDREHLGWNAKPSLMLCLRNQIGQLLSSTAVVLDSWKSMSVGDVHELLWNATFNMDGKYRRPFAKMRAKIEKLTVDKMLSMQGNPVMVLTWPAQDLLYGYIDEKGVQTVKGHFSFDSYDNNDDFNLTDWVAYDLKRHGDFVLRKELGL